MDIRNVDLNLLVILDTLLRVQSASRAADVLNMSQPAISSALKKLRLLLGDPLFARSAHGLQPTPRARQMTVPLQQILDHIRTDILQPPDNFVPKTAARCFKLSLTDVGELVLLPRLLARLRAAAPGVTVHSMSLPVPMLEDALRTGAVDVAVGYFPAQASALIHEQHLFSHSFVCLMRAGHPLSDSPMTLEQFINAEHVLVESRGRSHEIFDNELRDKAIARKVVVTVSHHLALPAILARSDLIAAVPFAIGRELGRGARLKIVEPPIHTSTAEVKQIWHARFENDHGNRWLREMLRDLFGEGRGGGNARRSARN
jgi:DNA-binding transcriptional LysR family regulator